MNAQGCSHAAHGDHRDHELEEMMLQGRMQEIGMKLLVLSGKGGVGKSTVAANLARSLAKRGFKVGLLDVDVHGPSIPRLMGLEGKRIEDNGPELTPLEASENLKVMSIGFLVSGADDAVIWRGPMKYGVIKQFLGGVNWGRLDYLVIDSPPGTGDEPLAVAQLAGSPSAAILVTTPQELAISDVRRSVSFCKKLELPIAGIIENMSGLSCPHCGGIIDLFKSGGGITLAGETSVQFLGRIPIDRDIVADGDNGTPFIVRHENNDAARIFDGIVTKIVEGSKIAEPNQTQTIKKENTMKIAIPLADGKLCMHFGHCEQFALVDVEDASKKIAKTTLLTPPPHEPGLLPRWLKEQGANLIIAGGMGQRAQMLFADSGVKVVVGAPPDAPEKLIAGYFDGTLSLGANACDH